MGNCSKVSYFNLRYPSGLCTRVDALNIYIHDIPENLSKKYNYSDDIAILMSNKIWSTIKSRLTLDMHILFSYLKNWRLKPSAAKTLFSTFHLYNKKTYRELNIKVNNSRLQFQASPTYLGIKLDCSLTFRQQLETLSAKTTAHVALIRPLACTTWGDSIKTSRISTQALAFSAAEYCAPVWCWTHQKAGYDPQQCPTHNLRMPACDVAQSTSESC